MSGRSTPCILSFSHVAKSYRAGIAGCEANVQALRNVSLSVRAGQLTVVAGGARAGKTTLLLCAAGMLRPERGEVRWPALTPRAGRAPAGIAYVGDRSPAYNFLTVRESLAYAVTVRDLHEPGSAQEVDALMAVADLADVADVRLGMLAPAQRARLVVALALVSSPRLVLVDNVALGAGPDGRQDLARMLARVARDGAAVVWACETVDMDLDAAVYRLQEGRLTSATIGEVADGHELESAYHQRSTTQRLPVSFAPTHTDRVAQAVREGDPRDP